MDTKDLISEMYENLEKIWKLTKNQGKSRKFAMNLTKYNKKPGKLPDQVGLNRYPRYGT